MAPRPLVPDARWVLTSEAARRAEMSETYGEVALLHSVVAGVRLGEKKNKCLA